MDSAFQAPDSSLSSQGTWILDSLSCIPDYKALQNFPRFRIKQKFGFPYMGKDNNSLCTDPPPPLPSEKIGEEVPVPIFTEGRVGSVQRLDNKCP